MKELTTTSYALLGLLALRPWSAYELAQQMQRGFAWYWPRAERAIYDEPKNLVRHGMATARAEYRGRQRRTVYEINASGRRALRRWLAEPSTPPRVESAGLVRLTFIEFGTRADAARAIRSLQDAASELEAIVHAVSGEYLASEGPFPGRTRQVAMTGRFLFEMASMFRRYASWVEEFVDGDDDPLAVLEALHAATAPTEGAA